MIGWFRRVSVAVVLLAVSTLAVGQAQQGQDSDLGRGTWTLNLAKSRYDPGPPPKSETRTFELRGGGAWIYTAKGVDAQGNPTLISFPFRYDDGLEYPTGVNAATGAKNSVIYRIIDAYTLEAIQKVNGQRTTTSIISKLSQDGLTRTYTTTGTNAQGQPVHNIAVYEKLPTR